MQYARKQTFGQKLTGAFSSVTSNRSIAILSLLVIIAALPITILLINNQTKDIGHAAGSTLNLPPDGQGVYEECRVYDPACLSHLQTIANGGFKLVTNYSDLTGSSAQQLLAYADQAKAVGMKVIWAFNDPAFWNGTNLLTYYPALAATCNCSTNSGFVQYLVNVVKSHSATWGYYIGDELDSSVYTPWKAYTDLVGQADPNHPRLIVQATTCNGCGNVNPYLSTFAPGVEVLGQDYYPIGNDNIVPYTQTGTVASGVQATVDSLNKQSIMVLQAEAWAEYGSQMCTLYPGCATFPTESQMQSMLTQTLQNSHPRLILWYSYFDILRSDNPTQHWNDLVTATNSIYTYQTPTISPTNTLIPTVTPTPMPIVNLIQNGSFENTGTNWLSPWGFQTGGMKNANITQVSGSKVDGNYSAKVYVPKASTTQYVQLFQGNLPLSYGRTYTIKFWAKAGVSRQISASVVHGASPWTIYFTQPINLTTSWQQYTLSFTAPQSDSNGMLLYNFSQHSGYVRVDAVSLQ